MIPHYDMKKLKYGTDTGTFERAVDLYEKGKVKNFKNEGYYFCAEVMGTHPYNVVVSSRNYDAGDCNCYLGERDILCKHMVAVAIYSIKNGESLTEEEKEKNDFPKCSQEIRELNEMEKKDIKKDVTEALSFVKPYTGPSKIWFQYQNSLSEGCGRLSEIVSSLPVGTASAEMLVNTLLRLEKKAMNGVDDSDGTVGDCMVGIVSVLEEYAKIKAECIKKFKKLENLGTTSFGWEEPLLEYLKKNR